jgi:asparagine synthase (glutamine-hydrolysing)
MCGIAGVVSFDGTTISEELLRVMGERLIHRGPDDGATWHNKDGDVGFSHRRLSIIDVAGSPQPMTSADKNTTICFNGEIFNYKDLRRKWDYPYKTNGDTETLLAGYKNKPDEFIHDLRGQFAFAIFDEANHELHLYRDRLGILPLYYYLDETRFVFASEIKALLPAIGYMPEIDKKSLTDFLGQRGVPAPNTLYKGIKKLEAGHHLTIGRNRQITDETWYRVPQNIGFADNFDYNDFTPSAAADQLDTLLNDAVSSALVADVPVGAYLSGGIDSSLICAMIAKQHEIDGGKLATFSARFTDGSSLDETPFARGVSKQLGTDHHEIDVTPQDFIDIWPKLSYQFDAPIPEPPDIAFSQLAKLARQHVTVVLSGEGSDELFAGYPKYQYASIVDKIRRLPAAIRKPILNTIQKALPASMNRQRTLIRAAAQGNELESFRTWFAPFTEKERKELFDHEGNDVLEKIHAQAEGDVVQRMSYVDLFGWLADNILERSDRTSMMHSLELRPPFLDVHIVEFARQLPSRLLVDRKSGKKIVRDVARRYLPQEIFNRAKHGFKVPLDDWFRGNLKDFAYDHLTSESSLSREMFDQKFVRDLLDNHVKGKFNDGMRIYTLVALEMWYRNRATI